MCGYRQVSEQRGGEVCTELVQISVQNCTVRCRGAKIVLVLMVHSRQQCERADTHSVMSRLATKTVLLLCSWLGTYSLSWPFPKYRRAGWPTHPALSDESYPRVRNRSDAMLRLQRVCHTCARSICCSWLKALATIMLSKVSSLSRPKRSAIDSIRSCRKFPSVSMYTAFSAHTSHVRAKCGKRAKGGIHYTEGRGRGERLSGGGIIGVEIHALISSQYSPPDEGHFFSRVA